MADPGRLCPNGSCRNRRTCRTLTPVCLSRCLKMDLEAQLVELSVWWAATLAFTEKICSVTQRKVSRANLKEEPDFQEALLLGIHQHLWALKPWGYSSSYFLLWGICARHHLYPSLHTDPSSALELKIIVFLFSHQPISFSCSTSPVMPSLKIGLATPLI